MIALAVLLGGQLAAEVDAGPVHAPLLASEPAAGAAEENEAALDDASTIVARKRDARRIVGSAHTVDQEKLERFEPDDVHRALRSVPGVYVRDEDGQGLRPNIGLRGASSDRSAKVALMEDGVLFAPAPYAAPAAYYFPLAARMTAIEVFKGPAAIRQGPHTVGGALNLRTRGAPYAPAASLDLGAGLVGPGRTQERLHGWAGAGDDVWGVVFETARVQSEGFKRVQGQPDLSTGFVRDDVMLKARLGNGLLDDVRHIVELKLGFQREESDETYLGLTDEDFRRDPLARYAASQGDHMSWWRTQVQLRYGFELADWATLDAVGYRHDLDRTWRKVNAVEGAPALNELLRFNKVGSNPLFMDALRGGHDDASPDAVDVLIGPNDRRFFSQGVATTLRGKLVLGESWWAVEQRPEIGLRLHHDGVTRRHSESAYTLVRGALIARGEPEVIKAENEVSAVALALHAVDEIRWWDLVVVPGVRVELIRGFFQDLAASTSVVESDQIAVLPGVGGAWQVLPWVSIVAGVHRGFSPTAPSATKDARPEESTNVEGGLRLDARKELGVGLEAIGFFSYYENLVGDCTFSSGCVDDVGRQYDGGAAQIAGAELLARHELPLRFLPEASVRTEATYTFTHASFLTTFDSPFPLFGRVQAGDEMAYVPAHQAAFTGAVIVRDLDVGASLGMISAMRDVPGQVEPLPTERTDPQAVFDLSASYRLVDGVRVGFRVDNVFDQRAIVSRRPFGARPGKPRTFMASLELDWGG